MCFFSFEVKLAYENGKITNSKITKVLCEIEGIEVLLIGVHFSVESKIF